MYIAKAGDPLEVAGLLAETKIHLWETFVSASARRLGTDAR